MGKLASLGNFTLGKVVDAARPLKEIRRQSRLPWLDYLMHAGTDRNSK